ncbi:inositol monophosphatase family protein [Planktothrix agardhii]|jgi:myo-inositol-1(or 4)-monophosphatase|uniref:Inositol-1-monophosphatase n=2 Tax=Planktothrix agardhii TaxID=1160 RepID=A0A073CKL0_PLAA1|nr:inositol monophosphatase family protein [Planktothrix agardhii]BBD55669.1 inositol monophosphatase family protein [Planktothrix agardhii NIES-204]KEI68457.1 ImpA [Planktothrix agardhii NIVA-CYA 126/8]MBG0748673.1 inositol monophosphatase [Planktothrix agardhii KL2]MCB8749951.1 inositol monophosphatase [Planktothrix agardhii 1810]MCB8758702.1 inositol monophosphatase [Planktothrix agardhii 1813]
MTKNELQFFLDVATLAAQAGGAVLKYYLGNLTDVQEKGRSGDLVTEADKASEAAILAVLERHVPDHGILTEESGELGDLKSPYLWAIDPLDGTTNFAHQYPFFSASIGLLINGVPQVGVIYDPFHDELFQAAKGLGATCNNRLISVSKTNSLDKSLLVTGFAYDRRETTDNNYAEFAHLTHLTQGVRRSGAASIDLAHTACGRLDGYWERGLSPWDMAAGIVLVEEAGGKVTAYDTSPFQISSGRILATNGYLHERLSQTLIETPALSSWKDK